MKVLLLKDVYNLGRAGEIKKVANGFGRNFLLPQGLATLATSSALKQAERIKIEADKRRNILNEEMAVIAEKFTGIQLLFPARAGETGKLYGSVTTQMLAEQLSEKAGFEIPKRQIDSEPLRQLGLHTIKIRLTMDIIPEVQAVVYREGENPENYMVAAEELAESASGLVQQEEVPAEVAAESEPAAPEEATTEESSAETASEE